jgi:hypothetical protein
MDSNRFIIGALFVGTGIWLYLRRWSRRQSWVAGLGAGGNVTKAEQNALNAAKFYRRTVRKGWRIQAELPLPLQGVDRYLAQKVMRGSIIDNGDGTYQIHQGGRWQAVNAQYAARWARYIHGQSGSGTGWTHPTDDGGWTTEGGGSPVE